MPPLKLVHTAAALALALAAAAAMPYRADAAGTAYQVDTAEVAEPGGCKVEAWSSFGRNHDFIGAASAACIVQMMRAVELTAQLSRSRSAEEWGTTLSPKFKTNLVPTAIGQWGVALTGTATVDLLTGEMESWQLNIPATLRLSNVARVNLNAGYQRDVTTGRNYLTYGAGVDIRTPDNKWIVTAEIFGLAGGIAEDDDKHIIRPRWQTGLRWRPVDEFSVDVIYGRNLTGENTSWITLATAYRFKAGER